MTELFNVCQFFNDNSYKYVKRDVSAKEAVDAVVTLCTSKGAQTGTTKRVIITDHTNCTNFEWQYAITGIANNIVL